MRLKVLANDSRLIRSNQFLFRSKYEHFLSNLRLRLSPEFFYTNFV